MILYLSFPEGGSVNDGIEAGLCSLHYTKVEDATEELVKQSRNWWMEKAIVRSAYQTVPIHP